MHHDIPAPVLNRQASVASVVMHITRYTGQLVAAFAVKPLADCQSSQCPRSQAEELLHAQASSTSSSSFEPAITSSKVALTALGNDNHTMIQACTWLEVREVPAACCTTSTTRGALTLQLASTPRANTNTSECTLRAFNARCWYLTQR